MKKSCIFAAWFKTNENDNENENRLKMKEQDNATPVRNEREHHLYVTIQSARVAGIELAAIAHRRWKEESLNNKKQIVAEIIDTYLPYAKPTEEEKGKLHLTDFIQLRYGKDDMTRYYDLSICNIHEPVKPINECIEISLTHWLALNEVDRQEIEVKERQEKLSESYFREIVYMKEKEVIEQMLPEALPYLQFEPYVYDTQFLREMIKREKDS